MRPVRVLCGFFIRFLLLFGVLMAAWPAVDGVYAAFFRAGGNGLFSVFGSDGRVRFLPLPDLVGGQDTEVLLVNRRTGAERSMACGSKLQGFKPTAFILSLIVATPIAWSRRWRAVIWGLVLIHVYVTLRILVFLLTAFSGDTPLALFSPGPVGGAVLGFLSWFLVVSYASWLIAPLPIWALVSFRASDWPTILQGRGLGSSTGRHVHS